MVPSINDAMGRSVPWSNRYQPWPTMADHGIVVVNRRVAHGLAHGQSNHFNAL